MSDDDRIELMMRFRGALAAILERDENTLPYSDGWSFLDAPSARVSTRTNPPARYSRP